MRRSTKHSIASRLLAVQNGRCPILGTTRYWCRL